MVFIWRILARAFVVDLRRYTLYNDNWTEGGFSWEKQPELLDKVARLSLFPFGKKVELRFKSHPIANVLWIIFGGWEMALFYLICGVINCITIIGIPKGLRCFKLMKLAFSPFGAKIQKA